MEPEARNVKVRYKRVNRARAEALVYRTSYWRFHNPIPPTVELPPYKESLDAANGDLSSIMADSGPVNDDMGQSLIGFPHRLRTVQTVRVFPHSQ